MQTWKSCSLGLYYWATLPSRRRAAVHRRAEGTEPVRVLFYHRVADRYPNAWTLSNQEFERQIRWLAERYDIVSLEEAQRRIAQGNDQPTVAITFDDGYADNFDFAIPLLLNRRIPFTYFVASNHVLQGEPFPHDVVAGRPLPPNTLEQLRRLVVARVEIGSHTRSHADLSRASHQEMTDEIVRSKWELEDALDCDVRYFAFPYGLTKNMPIEAVRIAMRAGYRGICSAYGAYNIPRGDAFHIKRFHADPERTRFANWMTVDPRKI